MMKWVALIAVLALVVMMIQAPVSMAADDKDSWFEPISPDAWTYRAMMYLMERDEASGRKIWPSSEGKVVTKMSIVGFTISYRKSLTEDDKLAECHELLLLALEDRYAKEIEENRNFKAHPYIITGE